MTGLSRWNSSFSIIVFPHLPLYGLFILESGLEFWPIYQLGQGRQADQLIKTSPLYVGYITCCLFTSRPTFAYRPLDCKKESKETTLSYPSLGWRIIKEHLVPVWIRLEVALHFRNFFFSCVWTVKSHNFTM